MGFLQWYTRRSHFHELLTQRSVQSFKQLSHASQKAVLSGDKGEPIECVARAGAGGELRCPTHRVRNHFSGELWINMLSVSWASLKDETIFASED